MITELRRNTHTITLHAVGREAIAKCERAGGELVGKYYFTKEPEADYKLVLVVGEGLLSSVKGME